MKEQSSLKRWLLIGPSITTVSAFGKTVGGGVSGSHVFASTLGGLIAGLLVFGFSYLIHRNLYTDRKTGTVVSKMPAWARVSISVTIGWMGLMFLGFAIITLLR